VGGFADLFELVDAKQRIYAKRAVSERLATRMEPFATAVGSREMRPPASIRRSSENVLGEVRKQADALVLSEFAPGGVVVNSRMDILQFRGRTEPFLMHGPGAASLNLLQMARQGLAMELRPLIARAAKQNRTASREGVQMRENGRVLSLNVRVLPFQVPPSEERFFLVLFEELFQSIDAVGSERPGFFAERVADPDLPVVFIHIVRELPQQLFALAEHFGDGGDGADKADRLRHG
jgi:two-component system CheB/CheR fusion protein